MKNSVLKFVLILIAIIIIAIVVSLESSIEDQQLYWVAAAIKYLLLIILITVAFQRNPNFPKSGIKHASKYAFGVVQGTLLGVSLSSLIHPNTFRIYSSDIFLISALSISFYLILAYWPFTRKVELS